MDALNDLNLPDAYTYQSQSQQGEDEIRVYIKEVIDEESALVCLVTIFFRKVLFSVNIHGNK